MEVMNDDTTLDVPPPPPYTPAVSQKRPLASTIGDEPYPYPPQRPDVNGPLPLNVYPPLAVPLPLPLPQVQYNSRAYAAQQKHISVNWQHFPMTSENVAFEIFTPYDNAQPQIRAFHPGSKDTLRLHIFTPPFCTNFPHLTADMSILQTPGTSMEFLKKQTKYLDLSMLGWGDIQREFRAWFDAMDLLLLDFIMVNQRLIGKSGESIETIKVLQRGLFRKRVCAKTGKQYEDSCVVKCKSFGFRGAGKPTIANAEENMVPVFNQDNVLMAPSDIAFHDMVSVSLRYDGCYAKPGIGFGHMWTLLAIKDYGLLHMMPTVIGKLTTLEDYGMNDGQERNPVFVFPEITDANDYPRQF